MVRRVLTAVLFLAALGAFSQSVEAQLNPGVHVARANSLFGGTNGAGASLQLSFPLFPIDLFVAGDYFFPDCGSGDGCAFMGGSADVHFSLPIPLLTPYATAGLVYRRTDLGMGRGAEAYTGFGAGVGMDLGALVLGGFGEVRYEVVDPDDQFVVRLGIRF